MPITSGLLLVEDSDTIDSPTNITYTLDGLPASPTGETDPDQIAGLYLEDELTGIFSRLSVGESFTQQDINDGRLEYRQNGQEQNQLMLDDQVLLSVEDSAGNTPGPIAIQINLTPVPDAPVVQQSGPWTVGENDQLPITSDQTISPNNGVLLVTDDDLTDTPDTLRYTIVSDNQSAGLFRLDIGSTASDPYTALTVGDTFTQQDVDDGLIVYRQNGQERVSSSLPDRLELTVVDQAGNSSVSPLTIDIDVIPENDVPELVGLIGQQIAQEGELFTLTFDNALWSDNDLDDVLDLNVVQVGTLALPDWLAFDQNTRTLSGTPQNADVGIVTLSVTAVDVSGAESSPLVFDLEILNTNNAPVDLSLLGQNVEENVAGAAIGLVSANDLDVDDVLTYSVNDSRFEIVSGELVLKPEVVLDHEAEASIDLTITVTDSAGEFANLDVTVDVDDSNDLPVLQSAPVLPLLQQNVPVQIPVDTFVDQDQFDNITYSATLADGSELPDWIEFTEQRELIVQSNAPAIEEISIILIAEDSSGGRAVLPLSLAIDPVLAAAEPVPELIEIPDIEPVAEIAPVVISPEPDTANEESEADDTTTSEPASVQPTDNEESNVAQIEQIDLQALIPPLENSDDLRQVEILESEFQVLSSNIVTVDIVDDFNVVELSGLFDADAQSFSRNFQGLVDALDNQRDSFSEELNFRQKVIGSTATLTSGFSVGYVIWLIRGGTLMGSMLSALPAWRFVDPLPILGALDDDDNGDDDSLEALVDSEDADDTMESSQNDLANQNDGNERPDQPKAA